MNAEELLIKGYEISPYLGGLMEEYHKTKAIEYLEEIDKAKDINGVIKGIMHFLKSLKNNY